MKLNSAVARVISESIFVADSGGSETVCWNAVQEMHGKRRPNDVRAIWCDRRVHRSARTERTKQRLAGVLFS